MMLKGVSTRRGCELLKGWNQKKKKKNRAKDVLEGMVVGKGNEGVVEGVVSCTEEDGGVMRVKIVVRKSELKQLVQVMNSGVKSTTMCVSSVEQRLNMLWKKKYVSTNKCWSPVLQSIPEEKLV